MDKRYLKNVGRYLLSAILSVLLVAYIIYHLVNSFSDNVETIATDVVTLSETYTADAYIFREEVLLYPSASGNVSFLYDDATMVKKGSVVANVYSSSNTEEVKSQVADIDKRINILQNSGIAEELNLSDSSSLDKRINDLYYTLEGKLNSGDLDYVFRRKDELLTLLNKRSLVVQEQNDYDTQIALLENEKYELTASLGGQIGTVTTASSGYVYSQTDGYENIFSSTLIDSFTLMDFEEMTQAEPDGVLYSAAGKVVTDYNWYIACEIPSAQQQYYTEGQTFTVNFPYSGDETLQMELYRIVSAENSDTTVIVFRCGNVPSGFNFLRKQSVDIIQQSYTGYRVPVSAVRIVDGKQGVYVKEGNVATFKEIVPITEIDGYFIVKEQDKLNDENFEAKLGLHDRVIVKGKNIYEDKIIQ